MASTKITRTSAISSEKKLTISTWIKRSYIGEEALIGNTATGSNWSMFYFDGANKLQFTSYINSSYVVRVQTNRVFNDVGAWYHLQATLDVSLSTPEAKIYVNGEEQTDLSQNVQPSQNANTGWFYDWNFEVGVMFGSSYYLNGCLADTYYIQGYVYPPSTFGEADSVSGIWKPKTDPTINYGGNGGNSCHLKFENSGNMDLDSGDNNLTFTTSGTLTQNVDTPSNNFATGNPLVMNPSYTGTFSNGNNKLVTSASGKELLVSTLAVSSGKWYAEYKAENVGGGTMIGVIPYEVVVNTLRQNNYLGQDNGSVSMLNTTGAVYNPPTASGITGVTYTSGDIIGVAVDLDNSYCYFHKNGTYINSGDPTSGATGTGGVPFTKGDSFWCFAGGDSTNAGGSIATISANFGQGYFGTTAVASANADDGGLGIMEYDVPANYRVLCTKNIKDYG